MGKAKPKPIYVDRNKVLAAVFRLYNSYGVRAVNSMKYYGVLEAIEEVPPDGVGAALDKCRQILDEAREKVKIPNPDGSKSEYYRGRVEATREILKELRK